VRHGDDQRTEGEGDPAFVQGQRARFIEMDDVGEMLVLVPAFEGRKHGQIQRATRQKSDDEQAGHEPPDAHAEV
jgi:hypothetical protein